MASMAAPLASKVALITGATRGIGRAIAMKLARAGCDIAAVYFSAEDAARSLRRDLEACGRRACIIRGDVGKPESVDKVFEALRQSFDRIDILVSNAASGVLRPAA